MILDEWRKLLSYDPETGEFRWLIQPANNVFIGDVAGSVNTRGYRNICYKQKWYGAHRLAWMFVYGVWPDRHMDHKNGDFSDNRIENLRMATSSQNNCNKKRLVNNKSGFKGVVRRKYAWEASIQRDGKWMYLGHFKTPEDAHAAYLSAAKDLHGEFARGE